VLSIQSGVNPRLIQAKLQSYLPPVPAEKATKVSERDAA